WVREHPGMGRSGAGPVLCLHHHRQADPLPGGADVRGPRPADRAGSPQGGPRVSPAVRRSRAAVLLSEMGRWKLAALGIGLLLVGAACAGKAGSTASSKPGAGTARPTVSVRDVMGVGSVLTDASGLTLYTPDQEAGGTIHCTGDCVKIWIPLRP